MPKVVKCHCGEDAILETSKGKHKVPFLRCPKHGVIMNRNKSWISYILSIATDKPDEVTGTDYKKESDLLQKDDSQESDLDKQTPVIKKPDFLGDWGTVL